MLIIRIKKSFFEFNYRNKPLKLVFCNLQTVLFAKTMRYLYKMDFNNTSHVLLKLLNFDCFRSERGHQYTARNARVNASCGFYRLDASLLSSQINQACCLHWTLCKLLKPLASSLWIKNLDNQLASSLLTTCSRLVVIKPEQAMRTHPDIVFMTARQQACSRLAATCAFLAL